MLPPVKMLFTNPSRSPTRVLWGNRQEPKPSPSNIDDDDTIDGSSSSAVVQSRPIKADELGQVSQKFQEASLKKLSKCFNASSQTVITTFTTQYLQQAMPKLFKDQQSNLLPLIERSLRMTLQTAMDDMYKSMSDRSIRDVGKTHEQNGAPPRQISCHS